MADDTTPSDDAGDKKKKGGGKRILLLVLCCGGLAFGGYTYGKKSAASAAAAAPIIGENGEELICEPAPPELPAGPVVQLDPLSLNLAGGRYLRVGVALQLAEDVVLLEDEEYESAAAKDIIVATLSGRAMEELSSPEGRDAVKAELTEHIHGVYGEEVEGVYFSEFVMQ